MQLDRELLVEVHHELSKEEVASFHIADAGKPNLFELAFLQSAVHPLEVPLAWREFAQMI